MRVAMQDAGVDAMALRRRQREEIVRETQGNGAGSKKSNKRPAGAAGSGACGGGTGGAGVRATTAAAPFASR